MELLKIFFLFGFSILLCNFIEIKLRHRCSPLNLLHISRAPFHKNAYGGLPLQLHISFAIAAESSSQPDSKQEPLASKCKSLTTKLRRFMLLAEVLMFPSPANQYFIQDYDFLSPKYEIGVIINYSEWIQGLLQHTFLLAMGPWAFWLLVIKLAMDVYFFI